MNFFKPYSMQKYLVFIIILLTCCTVSICSSAQENRKNAWLVELNKIEKQVDSFVANPLYPDDPFILATLKEAIKASHEENGGIGACLVSEVTGEIVELGHNRQFEPYYRSDLHAEMDLLTRYEERVKAVRRGGRGSPSTPETRKMAGLVLYTSVEPCPMCLTRIINTGIKKVFYAVEDETGGMVQKMSELPLFWQNLAANNEYKAANCSPELRNIARHLFRPAHYKR